MHVLHPLGVEMSDALKQASTNSSASQRTKRRKHVILKLVAEVRNQGFQMVPIHIALGVWVWLLKFATYHVSASDARWD